MSASEIDDDVIAVEIRRVLDQEAYRAVDVARLHSLQARSYTRRRRRQRLMTGTFGVLLALGIGGGALSSDLWNAPGGQGRVIQADGPRPTPSAVSGDDRGHPTVRSPSGDSSTDDSRVPAPQVATVRAGGPDGASGDASREPDAATPHALTPRESPASSTPTPTLTPPPVTPEGVPTPSASPTPTVTTTPRSVDDLNWRALATCESDDDPNAVNPAGYYGLYMFSLSTWRAQGGTGNPVNADRAEQTARAKILYGKVGASAWPSCGSKLYD